MTDVRPMTRGERVIAFIERYCYVPEGARVGQPMRLDEFQKAYILAVYDNPAGTTLAILSMARKNGKTALIAALVLVHVAGPEARQNSQIVSGATSKDQASIVFELAVKMVNLNPKLRRVVRPVPSRKRLYGLAKNVEFRALAADGKRAHGLSPVVAILDEVGQIEGPRSAFVDAITTAQGAHDEALLLVISTQAASDADMLSIWIDDARTSQDPRIVLAVHEAPKDAAVMDVNAWRAANPALGSFRSEKDLRQLAEKAARMPSFESTFRNLNLNQRVNTRTPFVSRDVWERGSRDLIPHEGVAKVFVGLDLSAVSDLTAAVALWEMGGQWNCASFFWAPEEGVADRAKRDRVPYDLWAKQGYLTLTPGATVDYDYVAAQLLEMFEGMDLELVNFDRWRIDTLKAALKRKDASDEWIEEKLKPFGQGVVSMAPALDWLEKKLLDGQIAHAGNPLLRMCAANAVVVMDDAGNRKFTKAKATGRIDGMVAAAMAAGGAAKGEADQPAPGIAFL